MKIAATIAMLAFPALAQTNHIALVKDSPVTTAFDISWIDNSSRYYLADRTNNAIDFVDAATDTFLGFIGKGHWAGDGDGNIIEADAREPGAAVLRKIIMASNDGDSPPFLTFVSAKNGSVLGHYKYSADQDGMEQPVWVGQTGWFYQNVPGPKNRIDVFDPRKLPNPVSSFSVRLPRWTSQSYAQRPLPTAPTDD